MTSIIAPLDIFGTTSLRSSGHHIVKGLASCLLLALCTPVLADDNAACTGLMDSTARLACFDQAAKQFATCLSNENQLKRLDCYDMSARILVGTSGSRPPGNWSVHSEKNGADVELRLLSTGVIMDEDGHEAFAELLILCADRDTYVELKVGGHSYTNISATVGQRKSRNEIWNPGNPWNTHPSPIPFIKEMMLGDSLELKASAEDAPPLKVKFITAGLAKAIEPLQDACRWR